MDIKVEKVTPKMAAEWLEHNVNTQRAREAFRRMAGIVTGSVPRQSEPRRYFFGCARGVWGHRDAGHYFFLPGGREPWQVDRTRPETFLPWGHVDAKLAPREWDSRNAPELPNGVAALHHKDGWTALSFWDQSGDSRGNSNSNFVYEGEHTFDEILALARADFPELFERFPFEVVAARKQAA